MKNHSVADTAVHLNQNIAASVALKSRSLIMTEIATLPRGRISKEVAYVIVVVIIYYVYFIIWQCSCCKAINLKLIRTSLGRLRS